MTTSVVESVSVADVRTGIDLIITDPETPQFSEPHGFQKVSYSNGWLTVRRMRRSDSRWIEVGEVESQRTPRSSTVLVWRDYRS